MYTREVISRQIAAAVAGWPETFHFVEAFLTSIKADESTVTAAYIDILTARIEDILADDSGAVPQTAAGIAKRPTIDVGDVVRLNSGGPEMTAHGPVSDNDRVTVSWPGADRRMITDKIPPIMLTLVRKAGEPVPDPVRIETEIVGHSTVYPDSVPTYRVKATIQVGESTATGMSSDSWLERAEARAVEHARGNLAVVLAGHAEAAQIPDSSAPCQRPPDSVE